MRITTTKELKEILMDAYRKPLTDSVAYIRARSYGVHVSAKVRRECLLSNEGDEMIVNGRRRRIVFTPIGGGVWLAKLGSEDKERRVT